MPDKNDVLRREKLEIFTLCTQSHTHVKCNTTTPDKPLVTTPFFAQWHSSCLHWHCKFGETLTLRGITFTFTAAVTLVLGWVVVGPLFVDQTVDDSFKLTMVDGSLNMPAIMALPQANRTLMRPRIMRAAAKIDAQASEPMPSNPTLVATGRFVDADARHKGSGDAMLYRLGSGEHLLRLESFHTTNGPALVVYLSKHANPTSAADVRKAEFLSLGKLKGNRGDQNYPIPIGTDIEQFQSVVIWCELFGVLFSPAGLSQVSS